MTDTTGTLTAAQQTQLSEKLDAFEARKGATVALLIVPTTQPEAIEQYGIRVAELWKPGRKESDDGAILIVAKDDRRLRIEVGHGLEGALTDATSKRIIAETITPLFRQGDMFGGIDAGLDQMMRVVEGEPLPAPDRSWPDSAPGIGNLLVFLFIAVPIASLLLRGLFGRPLGALATGGVAGALVWIVSRILGIAIGAGVLAFLFALITGSGRSGWASGPRYRGRRGLPGAYGGFPGGFGGSGGFGGGGGGWRGGGGSFGGGGASGSW